MLSETLSETSMFNLSTIGAISATNIKNTVQIIAQINLIGSSMISVITLINKVTPHPMINKIGFMVFNFLLIKIPVFPGCQNLYFTESSIRKVFEPTTASSVLRFSVDAPETTIRI